MNIQHELSFSKLIDLLHRGADFYRQAGHRLTDNEVADKLKSIVKVREIAIKELQPYLAAITVNSPNHDQEIAPMASTTDSRWLPSHDHLSDGDSIPLWLEDCERVEGETLAALDQAMKIPASQALQSLLTEIRGRTCACYHSVRQMNIQQMNTREVNIGKMHIQNVELHHKQAVEA